MGIGLGKWPFPRSPRWVMLCLQGSLKDVSVEGQFEAQEYTERVSTSWAEIPIPQRREPVLQWIRGDALEATFSARFWAERMTDDVSDKISVLKSSVDRDDLLGRPPVWRFTCGPIEFDCVVASVGGIVYDGLWGDGRIKGATLAISLRKVSETFTIESIDPSKKEHLSLYVPVVTGETYESIASRRYGDPMVGVLLRQEAKTAFPGPGEVVRLPKRSHFTRKAYEPQSYALGNSDAAKALRTERFNVYARAVELPFVKI